MPDQESNAFEDLCRLASDENWCWEMPCTTCGNGHFRWAFRELARGLSPSYPEWPVRGATSSEEIVTAMGPPPWRKAYTPGEIQSLQHIVAKAHLSSIAQQAKFPDWLGYIGLVLYLTQHAERSDPLISRGLVPQFLELVPAGSEAEAVLQGHLDAGTPLRWRELELIEQDMKVTPIPSCRGAEPPPAQ